MSTEAQAILNDENLSANLKRDKLTWEFMDRNQVTDYDVALSRIDQLYPDLLREDHDTKDFGRGA